MTTTTNDCGAPETLTRERKCLSCDIGAFCRNHYYRGKLLTERDFLEEQQYAADKARLHNLALHGWGVVCGLSVMPHERCPQLRFLVTAGLGIDCCGREVRILKPVEIGLPQPPPKHPDDAPCAETPAPASSVPPHVQDKGEDTRKEESYQKQELHKKDESYQQGEPPQQEGGDDYEEDHPDPYNPCDDEPQPIDLYVCIRYTECETEFSPAPFDDCNCNSNGDQPNRICEGFKIDVYDRKPDFWDSACDCGCESDDCGDFYRDALRHCQGPCSSPCLPLAVIRNFVPGKPVTRHQLDHSPRRQLATTATLDSVLRCVLDRLPTKELTRIIDLNWEHGSRLLCHQFMSEFIGSEKHPKGFEIRFDSKVYSAAIDPRSFQALIVYRQDNPSDPRHTEIAPARVETEAGETEWCRLQIDPNYARKHLDGKNFDLFLTLRCNVITGKHGLAVDGDFMATRETDDYYRMAFPTGNNIAGGAFESWIRVRPRPRGV